jgi:hypothetical protein
MSKVIISLSAKAPVKKVVKKVAKAPVKKVVKKVAKAPVKKVVKKVAAKKSVKETFHNNQAKHHAAKAAAHHNKALALKEAGNLKGAARHREHAKMHKEMAAHHKSAAKTKPDVNKGISPVSKKYKITKSGRIGKGPSVEPGAKTRAKKVKKDKKSSSVPLGSKNFKPGPRITGEHPRGNKYAPLGTHKVPRGGNVKKVAAKARKKPD